MNKISKILIPFNFKESAINALNYALTFSEHAQKTEIKLLYITADDESLPIGEISSKLAEFAINSKNQHPTPHSQLSISTQIKAGNLVEQTLRAKEEFNADLILMGTKGSNEGSKTRSTNTSKLIHQAECPVIVVPQSFNKFNLKNITLAIDKSEIEKPELMTVLLVIARRFDAKIHVLTVYDEEDEDYLKDLENEGTLRYYFEKYYDTSSAIRSSGIAKSILEYDKRQSIDMLAIIPRNHVKDQLPSEGKLTQYLTMNTDIPLLTID